MLKHDSSKEFHFAPLQGEFAARTLSARGLDPSALDTVFVLTPDERVLSRSEAILFVLSTLGGFWRLLATVSRPLPGALLDRCYDALARMRYRIFGRFEACTIPRAEDRERFL